MYKNTFPQSSDKMEMEVTREATQYFLLCFANGGILGSNRNILLGVFSVLSLSRCILSSLKQEILSSG